jgi:hypothetical protein
MSLARAHTDKQQEQSRTGGAADPLVLWEDTTKWVDQIKKQATSK